MTNPHPFDMVDILDDDDLFDPETGDITEDAADLLADDDMNRRFV